MKSMRGAALLVGLTLAVGVAQGQIRLGNNTDVVFASGVQGRAILVHRDDYVLRMSPFDRAARLKTNKAVSQAQLLDFVGRHAREWSDEEIRHVTSALQEIQPRFKALGLPLPRQILLVKTTGDEDAGVPYTRANAFIIPEAILGAPPEKLRDFFIKGVFHILLRARPDLRERLYGIIGFKKCDEVEFPLELRDLRITNPDAPRNDHCILVAYGRRQCWAVPILFSRNPYNSVRGAEVFDYLEFRFLLVERQKRGFGVKVISGALGPMLVGPEEITGLLEQVGSNTPYLYHPEEILAYNFVPLISGKSDLASPEIVSRMGVILRRK